MLVPLSSVHSSLAPAVNASMKSPLNVANTNMELIVISYLITNCSFDVQTKH